MSEDATLWRIAADTPDHEAHDLSGKGAERSGGRWNRIGTPLVYCSEYKSLAALETLVHLAKHPLPMNRYLVRITVPASVWAAAITLDGASLVGWDAEPAGKASLDWGTRWQQSRASLLARVPSVVVPDDFNVLINPLHPDLGAIKGQKIRRWTYDPRLSRMPAR